MTNQPIIQFMLWFKMELEDPGSMQFCDNHKIAYWTELEECELC